MVFHCSFPIPVTLLFQISGNSPKNVCLGYENIGVEFCYSSCSSQTKDGFSLLFRSLDLKCLQEHSLHQNGNLYFFVIFNHKMNSAQFVANIKNLQLYKAINQGHFHNVNQSALAYSQWMGCRNLQPTRNRPEQNQWPLSWQIIYLPLCYSCSLCKFRYIRERYICICMRYRILFIYPTYYSPSVILLYMMCINLVSQWYT